MNQSKFEHVKKRLKERFDIDIDVSNYHKLCELSNTDGLYYSCYKPSENVDLRVVRFKGRVITTVYDHKMKYINSVLYTRPRNRGKYKEMRDRRKYRRVFRLGELAKENNKINKQ